MSSKSGYKVLVVDDEEDILELLKYNLQKEGYDVKTALNGKKAVEIAKSYIPDLVVLDIMMPNQDGVETCRQLREIPDLHQTYILFLTARAEEYSEVAAFDVGADDYIVKPIKPRALMSRISALFRRKRSGKHEKSIIRVNDLVIDKSSYTVSLKDKNITLPKKEFCPPFTRPCRKPAECSESVFPPIGCPGRCWIKRSR